MEVKKKLDSIFNLESNDEIVQEIINRGYVASEIEQNKILFVGLNPSYISGSKPNSYFYKVNNAVKEYPKYYKKFNDLMLRTQYNKKWSYIDLFFFRETNQKRLNLIIRKEPMFIVEQLRVTNEIIKNICPKVIIVANSIAANFFGIKKFKNKKGIFMNVWLGLDFEFDENTGLMKVIGINDNSIIERRNLNYYKDTFFLFTSTLTYMNVFEKERISWLIDKV